MSVFDVKMGVFDVKMGVFDVKTVIIIVFPQKKKRQNTHNFRRISAENSQISPISLRFRPIFPQIPSILGHFGSILGHFLSVFGHFRSIFGHFRSIFGRFSRFSCQFPRILPPNTRAAVFSNPIRARRIRAPGPVPLLKLRDPRGQHQRCADKGRREGRRGWGARIC
jgi:hypothetical protein